MSAIMSAIAEIPDESPTHSETRTYSRFMNRSIAIVIVTALAVLGFVGPSSAENSACGTGGTQLFDETQTVAGVVQTRQRINTQYICGGEQRYVVTYSDWTPAAPSGPTPPAPATQAELVAISHQVSELGNTINRLRARVHRLERQVRHLH